MESAEGEENPPDLKEAVGEAEEALGQLSSGQLEGLAEVIDKLESGLDEQVTSREKQEFFPILASIASKVLPAVAPTLLNAGAKLMGNVFNPPSMPPTPTSGGGVRPPVLSPQGTRVASFRVGNQTVEVYIR